MRKIKFLLATMFAALFFTACGNKYSVENLKKNEKFVLTFILNYSDECSMEVELYEYRV